MLNSDMDAFGDDSVSDLFVDNYSDGAGVDVEYCSGSSVVVLVGESFVDGSIYNDIDDVADSVGGEGLGDVNGSVIFESFGEFMSCFSLVSV